jgi:hypothetical protein
MNFYHHIKINLFTLITLFTFTTLSSYSQKLPSVNIIQDSIKSSFRGLSVPSDSVIWVSGSNGTIGRTTDAGNTWKWMIVPGFEKRDFRDIEAFDSSTAIIMAVDNPAYILKTKDGGNSWKVVFEKDHEGMFLDAMDFAGDIGICIGDPIVIDTFLGKRFYILNSDDKGDSWTANTGAFVSPASSAEFVFAASGSNIINIPLGIKLTKLINPKITKAIFITGGVESNIIFYNLYGSYRLIKIPIMQGNSSTGAFSIITGDNGQIYIAGGDYNEYWKDSGNVVYTTNAGWKRSSVHGYRSCIIQTAKKTFITCGTNGVDISFDGCKTWKLIHGDGAKGKDGFNVCAKSKAGKAVYFAGTGRIAKLIP